MRFDNIRPVTDEVQAGVLAEWWPTFRDHHDATLAREVGKKPVLPRPAPIRLAKMTLEDDGAWLREEGVSDETLAKVFGVTAVRVRQVLGDGFE